MGRFEFGQHVGGFLAAALPLVSQRLVSGDGVEPGAQLVGVAQLRQFRRRRAEGVLNAVGGGVAVAQHADAEVVQPVGVPVVDRGERRAVTGRGGRREISVGGVPVGLCGHAFAPCR